MPPRGGRNALAEHENAGVSAGKSSRIRINPTLLPESSKARLTVEIGTRIAMIETIVAVVTTRVLQVRLSGAALPEDTLAGSAHLTPIVSGLQQPGFVLGE